MYTLEQLQQKALKELKEIGWQLNVLPAGDRRCRQNWIDAIVGVNPPLLALLEVSPGVEVESVAESIEIQHQEPIEVQVQEPIEIQAQEPIEIQAQEPIEIQAQEPIEIQVRRIVYPKLATEPIAQNAEITPELDRAESADVHNRRSHPAEPDGDSSGAQTETLGNQKGDRVLAVAGNGQTDRGRVLLDRPDELVATFNDEQPPNRGDGKGRIEPELSQSAIARTAKFTPGIELDPSRARHQWITFSARFLALYPPYFGEVNYKADATGQLNFLEPETTEEPPDPDDFDSIGAFWEAMARWDAEYPPEPLEVSMTSMCEWAPCPLEWYEPETIETIETVSCTLEIPPVSVESSSTCKFLIPVFGGFADRTNNNDEPPTAGVGARLPLPKPPSFSPMAVVAGDRSSIKQFARSAILLSGRAPPGGDAM
jgi:hypothetical protein